MEERMTVADKTFLKRVFPNSKIVISEAPALNVNDKETATESIGVSPMFDDCARAIYKHKVEELNFELKQHKSLRCAKCFKKATFQTNCCEFHVYCDDCSKDPTTIAVTCLPKDIPAKREIGRSECFEKNHWTHFFIEREEQLKVIVKHWHKKNKENFIMDELTQTHLKEIFASCYNEGLRFYRHDLETEDVVQTEPIIKTESVVKPDISIIKTENSDY